MKVFLAQNTTPQLVCTNIRVQLRFEMNLKLVSFLVLKLILKSDDVNNENRS